MNMNENKLPPIHKTQDGMLEKFYVIKREDARQYLSDDQQKQLADILKTLRESPLADGGQKTEPSVYLVVSKDEKYADAIINILKSHGHWGDANTKWVLRHTLLHRLYLRNEETFEQDDAYTDDLADAKIFDTFDAALQASGKYDKPHPIEIEPDEH